MSKESKYKKIIFPLIAILIGLVIAILLLGVGECFLFLNSRYHWFSRIEPRSIPYTDPKQPPAEIDITYLSSLKPYQGIDDLWEVEDYKDMYSFKDCTESLPVLTPYWLAKKNCNAHIVLKKKSSRRVVYDVFYNYDEHGLRKIPSARSDSDRFLLFLGCSVTMGEGISGEDTFSNRLTKKLSPVNAFNLGMLAYGPHQTNQLLRNDRKADIRLQAIHGEKGIAIYTFIDDHVRRAMNTLDWTRFQILSKQAPYFRLEDGKLVLVGPFESVRPYRTKLFELLSYSKIISFFRFDFPLIGDEELGLFSAIISDMKQNLEANYNVKKFIFAVFPEQRRYSRQLIPLLEKSGVEVFDFSNIVARELFHGHFLLRGNLHPSAEANRFYADLLDYEIRKRGILNYLK